MNKYQSDFTSMLENVARAQHLARELNSTISFVNNSHIEIHDNDTNQTHIVYHIGEVVDHLEEKKDEMNKIFLKIIE